jgi:hypothetical protein
MPVIGQRLPAPALDEGFVLQLPGPRNPARKCLPKSGPGTQVRTTIPFSKTKGLH